MVQILKAISPVPSSSPVRRWLGVADFMKNSHPRRNTISAFILYCFFFILFFLIFNFKLILCLSYTRNGTLRIYSIITFGTDLLILLNTFGLEPPSFSLPATHAYICHMSRILWIVILFDYYYYYYFMDSSARNGHISFGVIESSKESKYRNPTHFYPHSFFLTSSE